MKLNEPQIHVTPYGAAIITKTKEAQPCGEYKRTALDERKDAATMLLQQVGPRVVRSKVDLTGRGVKKLNEGTFQLTESAWKKASATHTWACDF